MPITDFTGYTTGESPTGWQTTTGGTSPYDVRERSCTFGERILFSNIQAGSTIRLYWSNAGEYGDVDIAIRFQLRRSQMGDCVTVGGRLHQNSGSWRSLSAVLRWVSGTGYYVSVQNPFGGGDWEAVGAMSEQNYYWMRVRMTGTLPNITTRIRLWDVRQHEPASWLLEYDTNLTQAQMDGLANPGGFDEGYVFHAGSRYQHSAIDVFGVGAPTLDISDYRMGRIYGTFYDSKTTEAITYNGTSRVVEACSTSWTDTAGDYELYVIPRSNVSLWAATECYVPQRDYVTVSPGTNVRKNWTLTPITGHVKTPLDLYNMRFCPNKKYWLINNIDMAGFTLPDYAPNEDAIGGPWESVWDFYGELDGQNYAIQNLSVIKDGNAGNAAFVYGMYGTTFIHHTHFLNASIAGGGQVGIITSYNLGTIEDCIVSGTVAEAESGWNWAYGGAVGYNTGTIKRCASLATVAAGGASGGLVGANNAVITDCYARGDVTGTYSVGGLVGEQYGPGAVSTSYATGFVDGDTGTGGLIGSNDGFVFYSYYDTETTGQTDDLKGLPRTTEQMTFPYEEHSTYITWDWNLVWNIHPERNDGYPQFQWPYRPIQLYGSMDIETELVLDWIQELSLAGSINMALHFLEGVEKNLRIWVKSNGVYMPANGYCRTSGQYRPVKAGYVKDNDAFKGGS